jgi:hypothetical protein
MKNAMNSQELLLLIKRSILISTMIGMRLMVMELTDWMLMQFVETDVEYSTGCVDSYGG